MSRSLHTQQWKVRAQRRLARPYSKRRREADYLSGRREEDPVTTPPRLPIRMQKPLPGRQHPLTVRDIRVFLATLGPDSIYRLKSIRIRQESALRAEGIVFAEYILPGEIHLYAVPESPWRLPFLLMAADRAAFERYGARVVADLERAQTTVHWSAGSLQRFLLYEVLAHELGHHLLQCRQGKRTVTICRRSDHEKRADLQSRRALKAVRRGDSHL